MVVAPRVMSIPAILDDAALQTRNAAESTNCITEGRCVMSRMLTPWVRFPQLAEWDFDVPRWMARLFDENDFGKGMFVPEANVLETEKAVEVTMELPGMKPEEVKVEMSDGRLYVSGEKREEKEEKGKTFHRLERRTGEFRRVINLPAVVDDAKAEATFAEGVLKVSLPKSVEAAPKAIPVKAQRKA
jgi:HSP20 family protein